MKKLPQTEPRQNGDKDFRRHERTPGEGPALLHAADDKWKGGRKNHLKPDVKALRTHGERGPPINWGNISHARLGGDNDRPESAHDDNEQHGGFGLSKPLQG